MIENTLALRQTIDDPGLIDLTGHISHLPATPEIFAELRQCLSGTACDIPRITDLIRRDPALTARFMQIANSAWFTRGARITISAVPSPTWGWSR
jgi:HD-like signal output (HDOD) protein